MRGIILGVVVVAGQVFVEIGAGRGSVLLFLDGDQIFSVRLGAFFCFGGCPNGDA
jgi:hypothetical protein